MTKTDFSQPEVKARETLRGGRWFSRVLRVILLAAGLAGPVFSAGAQTPTFEIVRTNWVARTLTNVVVVTMPRLYVVNEYRTNILTGYITNIIEIQRTQWDEQFVTNLMRYMHTNLMVKTLTNFVSMSRYATNVVALYQTNWITHLETNVFRVDRYRTNRINIFNTNWLNQTETNTVSVALIRTNRATVTLTNWGAVLLLKTNWISRNQTNLAVVNLPTPTAAASGSSATIPAMAPPQDFILTWDRAAGGDNEIGLQLRSAADPATIIPASEWRVERSDTAVLLMGHGMVFSGELPDGDYNVTVKYHPEPAGAAVSLGATIQVTASAGSHQAPATVIDRQK